MKRRVSSQTGIRRDLRNRREKTPEHTFIFRTRDLPFRDRTKRIFHFSPKHQPYEKSNRPVSSHNKLNPMKPTSNLTLSNALRSNNLKKDRIKTKNFICTGNIEEYQFGQEIGKGAYGIVKSAIHLKSSSRVAIKVYEKVNLTSSNRRANVDREIKILSRISHPHIVKFYESIETESCIYLVLEHVRGMSLYHYIKRKTTRKFCESEAKQVFKAVMQAVEYCHSKNISHRDIKLENVLIDSFYNVKLIDFGFSTCSPVGTKMKIFCGTPSYMAPEIVERTEFEGTAADIWACGVLLYVLLTGKLPFRGSNSEVYEKIKHLTYPVPENVSRPALSLILSMMDPDPVTRWTAGKVLSDPWLCEHRGTFLNKELISPKFKRFN